MNSIISLKNYIKSKKEELDYYIDNEYSLTEERVIKKSEEIDEIINKYIKTFSKKDSNNNYYNGQIE